MTTPVAVDLAGANLVETYCQLALATPGSRLISERGFKASVGNVGHPVCNFAVDLDLDEDSAKRLHAFAESHRHFNVYAMPGDEPANLRDLLEGVGFRLAYSLSHMIAEPRNEQSELQLEEARHPNDREDVAHFMVEQFFAGQTGEFRRTVARSTSMASSLNLYSFRRSGSIIAAIMTLRQPGGVYNVCVAPEFRRRGLGTELVSWALSEARGSMVSLQCEPRIRGWYEKSGFEAIGIVGVYSLPDRSPVDIMDTG